MTWGDQLTRDQAIGSDGLTRDDRDLIRKVLARYPDVRRVTLFGSRAMGTFGHASDIDLALEGPDLTQRTLTRIATDLEDSDLPYKVDLLLRDDLLEPKLEAHIRRHGRPFGWETTTFGELAAPENGAIAIGPFGSSMKADVYVPKGVPLVRGTNLDGHPGFRGNFVFVGENTAARFGRCLIAPGDLVFPHRGSIGEVGLAVDEPPGRWLLSTSMMKFRANRDRLDPLFAFHFFRSQQGRHELLKNASHVGTPGIGQPLASLRSCHIPVPPVGEQRAIASVLGALDDKIEQNRRTARALERLAQAIFRAWFVDFEPVKAKAAGAASFPGMRQPVFDALPTRFVDSTIGLVPEGWGVKAVSAAFDVNPTRSLRKDETAPYLDMKNMPTEGHAPESWIDRPFSSGMRFMNGDTLVARITPCLENGKTAFVDFLDDGRIAWGSTEYIVLRPKPPLPPIFAYCLARTGEFRDFAIQNMTGTSGRQRVAPTAVDHFRVAIPSEAVAVGFGETVNPMFDCIRAGMCESRKLAEMRDYLLPKLLSGHVRSEFSHG